MAEALVFLGDGTTTPRVTIRIIENLDGNGDPDGTFQFEVTQSGPIVGDLRGLFFDVGGGKDVALGAAGAQVAATVVDASGVGVPADGSSLVVVDGNDTVTKAGSSSNNMSGALSFNDLGAEAKGYDVGIEFGTEGIGKDDVRAISFTLTNTVGLTLADLAGMDFGVRMMSVGLEGGDRSGSVKLTSASFLHIEDGDESIGCVDEDDTATGDLIVDSQGAGTGVTLTQILKGFEIDANDNGTIEDNEKFSFDGTHTPITVDLAYGAKVTVSDDGTYTVDATGVGDNLDEGEHEDFTLTYSLKQTYTDASGDVLGELCETSTLDFDICGTGTPPPPPPPTDHFPVWQQPGISHVTFYFDTEYGDVKPKPDGDNWFTVKIDNVPGTAPDDLDVWFDEALAYIQSQNLGLDASTLQGVAIKGGQEELFYALDGNPDADSAPSVFVVEGNELDKTYEYTAIGIV